MSLRAQGRRGPLRVLVVDDSVVVRQAFLQVLDRPQSFQVTVAADPIIAQQKMQRHRPDVIVLDLEMPRMHGLTFLQQIMESDPIPVVVCSGLVGGHSDQALRALEEGAVELVAKGNGNPQQFFQDSADRLRQSITAAARARVRPRGRRRSPPPRRPSMMPQSLQGLNVRAERIVALGASTGGTVALHELLTAMPAGAPGILVVQHMPAGFTRAFADRLDGLCRVRVKEAETGDAVEPGTALIAPGDRHLTVQRRGTGLVASLGAGPEVSGHRPSVDTLFHSVATVAGDRAVAALLTGMGADGAEGLVALRQAGARTAAQDEQSSVVFGMPKVAIDRGAAQAVLPLHQLPSWILKQSCAPVARKAKSQRTS